MNTLNNLLLRPRYRADIDGLRAIAVLCVVGFHAAPGRIAGGFIGVDIFFVISGYLISTIIFKNLESQRFSFVQFYANRVRRIFPALVFTLLACLVFAALVFTPEEFSSLGRHIAAGAGFYSNFLLWQEIGYFDNLSTMKPLLHLWSLSIEEQFYIVWPLFLWMLYQVHLKYLVPILVLTCTSFLLNVSLSSDYNSFTFYFPITRAWELLIGSVLAHVYCFSSAKFQQGVSNFRNSLSTSGLIVLIIGLLLIDEWSVFPGWWAAIPVLGTSLLILGGPEAWVNRTLLSVRPLVAVGLISYPLYLTHWPILSFLRIIEDGEIDQILRIYALVVSFALATFIYHFVEKPIRFRVTTSTTTTALGVVMVTICVSGLWIHQERGTINWIGVQPDTVNDGSIGEYDFFHYMSEKFHPCTPISIREKVVKWEQFERCYQSKPTGNKEVAIIGDSHGEHLFIGVAEELKNQNVVYYAGGGLPLLNNSNYAAIYRYVMSDDQIKVVLLAGMWARDLKETSQDTIAVEIGRLTQSLTNAGKRVYLVDNVPIFPFKPSRCKYAGRLAIENICTMPKHIDKSLRAHYRSMFEQAAANSDNTGFLNVADFLCNDSTCSMSDKGKLYYRDKHHLNVAGSQALWRHIMNTTTFSRELDHVF